MPEMPAMRMSENGDVDLVRRASFDGALAVVGEDQIVILLEDDAQDCRAPSSSSTMRRVVFPPGLRHGNRAETVSDIKSEAWLMNV